MEKAPAVQLDPEDPHAGGERLSSVATAARILREFDRQSTQLGVTQLARQVGVAKSTAHRVIWTLVDERLLEKVAETGKFRLTSTMRSLGANAETAQQLHEASTVALDRLRSLTNGTLHIAILDGTNVLYVERREGPGAVNLFRSVGRRNVAHATSTGKVLLAFLPHEQLAELLPMLRLVARTSRTIASLPALRAELAQIHRQGFAENRGESKNGMCSVAAPIRNSQGMVVAAVSVAEPASDVAAGLRHLIPPILETAALVSQGLGWRK